MVVVEIEMKQITFDRGTLLLKGFPNTVTENNSNSFLWDSRVSSHRAPAYLYAQLRRKFIDVQDQVEALQPPPILREAPQLRPYQNAALAAWERNGCRGILCLPMGSGKTLTAIGAIALLRIPTWKACHRL